MDKQVHGKRRRLGIEPVRTPCADEVANRVFAHCRHAYAERHRACYGHLERLYWISHRWPIGGARLESPRLRQGMINRLAAVTVAMALAGAVAAARAQPDAVGVRGSVGNHEGTPVAEGTVSLQSSDRSSIVTASLDRSGRFHVVPSVAGRHRL